MGVNQSKDKAFRTRLNKALAVLKQKVDAVQPLVASFSQLPPEKRKTIEHQLWGVFCYGEYYVKYLLSELSDRPLVEVVSAGNFGFYKTKYPAFYGKMEKLIPLKYAPERVYVELHAEWRVMPPLLSKNGEPQEMIYPADYNTKIPMDHYEKIVQEYLPERVASRAKLTDAVARDIHIEKTNPADIPPKESTPIHSDLHMFLGWLENDPIWADVYYDGETWDHASIMQNFLAIQRLVAKDYFRPDRWLKNGDDLLPIFVTRLPKKIRTSIRERILEIQHSYIFGNWMAVIALSRSLLEFVLIQELDKKDVYEEIVGDDGDEYSRRKNLKKLSDLILAKISPKNPHKLANAMHKVRKNGNAVMHPQNGEFASTGVDKRPSPKQIKARQSFRAISEVISVLYGD